MKQKKLVGYARVSTGEQNLDLQIKSLKEAGCSEEHIFSDKLSGTRSFRPGLEKCIEMLETGDTLIVWRLDRLGRSMSHLIQLVSNFKEKGIRFKSICDGAIDTTTASGELVFNVFSSLSQFERRLIQERTLAGLKAARSRGRSGGRKKIPATDPKVVTAKKMHEDKSIKLEDIYETLQISRATLYRYLKIG